ncbi:MAG TPA: polyphosphate kinase 2 family protein [Candidatus Limnocylindria bacterium]|nr:polyphosphate kinase 2 family protein [Candidatus Limnocylindria bacterium]
MNTERYRIAEPRKVDLKRFPTGGEGQVSKDEIRGRLLPANVRRMADLQERLFAENTRSLLVVLQAMDAAGKDGVIRHVMSGINPQGVQVVNFKAPSAEENDQTYLWRVARALPRRGEIGVFNRSHYEDVLVARVHDLVRRSQFPQDLVTDDFWERRYRQIRDFERYLVENGTAVVKFFLHVSKDEQRGRLLSRITEPDKHWKFSRTDTDERQHWDEYQQAYELMLGSTSAPEAPWYVVPADDKWFTRLVVSQVVRDTLEAMDPQYPELASEEREAMEECRRILEEDGGK